MHLPVDDYANLFRAAAFELISVNGVLPLLGETWLPSVHPSPVSPTPAPGFIAPVAERNGDDRPERLHQSVRA